MILQYNTKIKKLHVFSDDEDSNEDENDLLQSDNDENEENNFAEVEYDSEENEIELTENGKQFTFLQICN